MKARGVALRSDPKARMRPLDSRAHSDLIRVILEVDGPGVVENPGLTKPVVAVHVGPPVRLECRHGREKHVGLAIHGDIDVVPAGVAARRAMKQPDTALLITVATQI